MALSHWLNLSGRIFVSAVALVCTTELIWHSYKKYRQYRRKINTKKLKAVTEVFFFSENSAACRTHLNSYIPCVSPNCPIFSMQKITSYLASARRTLDVCVYFFTFPILVKEIIKLQRKNVIIRVITDNESQENDATQILTLRKAGIQIRTKKCEYLMHHKFAIIDKELLISGSANWTLQAFFGNCENVFVTNHTDLVKAFNREFEILWLKFNCEKIYNNSKIWQNN